MDDLYERVWQQFRTNPLTKPSAAGRHTSQPSDSGYLVYLIALDEEEEVARAARRLQARLDLPFVDPVPADALHITVQGVDYRDRLTPEQQVEMVERAALAFAGLRPFDVTIRGASSFDVAVFFEVHDGGAIREARARLRAELPWLADSDRDSHVRDGHDTYLPHVSVAYYSAEADASEVAAILAEHRGDLVARVRVTEVKLIEARLPLVSTGWSYLLEHSFPLVGHQIRLPGG